MNYLSKFCFAFTYPCPRKLREIMKLSLIERENKENCVKIWMDYHKDRPNNVAYVCSKQEYEIFNRNTKESPLFLQPLRRDNGFFNLIGQVQNNSILFTYLEDYKRSSTFSAPYFIVTMFDELLFKKEIVLLRGDIMDYKVTQDEAFFLMNQCLRQYLTVDIYNQHVYNLNHNQEEFDFEQFKQLFSL